MSSEDESKRAEPHTLQETARNLEEKIFDAKDATLRLWERNRQLHHRVGGLERRVRVLTWLALGLMLGSKACSPSSPRVRSPPYNAKLLRSKRP
jgi:hypothetical protein